MRQMQGRAREREREREVGLVIGALLHDDEKRALRKGRVVGSPLFPKGGKEGERPPTNPFPPQIHVQYI